MLAATGSVAAALLLKDRDERTGAMALALAAAGALVAGEAWHDELAALSDPPIPFGIGVLLGLGILVGLIWAFIRWPYLLPLAILAMLPFRIPIDAGGETSNLLVPLYAVLLAGLFSEAERPGRPQELGAPRPLRLVLAAVVMLYAAQSFYSSDVSAAVLNVAFFLVPFGVAFVLLASFRWTARLLKMAIAIIVAEAVVFALIGVIQHEAGVIFWNDLLQESNEFQFSFRVNSLFWDPNIYGRYLALTAVVLMACLMWMQGPRDQARLGIAIAVVWTGLVFAFSQTSYIALMGGLVVLAALRWSLRWTLVGLGVLTLSGAIFLIAFGSVIEFDLGSSLDRRTSGRASLLSGGLELAEERPVFGHGSGSFGESFRQRNKVREDEATVSHTEPVTVAAEQGILGLAAYLALLAVALSALYGGIGRASPGLSSREVVPWPGWLRDRIRFRGGRRPDVGRRPDLLARVGIAAGFVALLVHTMGYAAYLTDPITWALLAVGGSLARS